MPAIARPAGRSAFSLVEIVLALGIMSFALLTVLALLPLGVRNNQISAEETRAAGILTELEADLRNSRLAPGASPLRSPLFGLDMPYALTVTGAHEWNASLAEGTLYSTVLDENEKPASGGSGRYQASVIYTKIPSSGQMAPIEARLIVNWPAIEATSEDDLTNLSSVNGYVENYVTFPAP